MFILFFLFFSINLFADATYIVNGVNNPPTSYATIQAAIDAIPNNLSGQGVQTVQIDSGLYSESLLIDGFSNASASDYVFLRAKPGHLHGGRHNKGVRVSGTGNPMVDIWTSYTRIQDIVFIQSGSATSSTVQARSGVVGALFERLIIVRNGDGFIFINNTPGDVTLRSSILISNYSGAGGFWCVSVDGSSVIDNTTMWTDGDRNGSSGCAIGVALLGSTIARNVVVFGPGQNFGNASSGASNYNFSRDNTAPGANSFKNLPSDTLHFVDTTNWDLHIGDSSKSILTDAGVNRSASFNIDVDSTCFGSGWSMGAHDPNTETNCNPSTVSIIKPFEGKVFQRNASNNCTKYIMSGTYEGTPDSLQYKAQGNWIKIDNVSGGSFIDTVTVDTGSWALKIRQKPDTSAIDSVALTGCGEVVALLGESNITEGGAQNFRSSVQSTGAFTSVCNRANRFYRSPVGDLLTGSGTGKVRQKFGDLLTSNLKVPVSFLEFAGYDCSMITNNSGIGGRPADWHKGGRCFDTAMVMIRACEVDTVGSLVFYGGEESANKGYTIDSVFKAYAKASRAWADSFRTTSKIMLNQIGPYLQILNDAPDSNGIDSIRWGGIKLIVSDTNLALSNKYSAGATLYDINPGDFSGDSIHFGYADNSQGRAELDTVASRIYRLWVNIFRGDGLDHPPYVKRGSIVNDSVLQLTIFRKNKIKTKNGIKSSSFEAFSSGSKIYIDSVRITNDSTIRVYLSDPISSDTAYFSLASKNLGVQIDLTDSSELGDNYNLPVEPCLRYRLIRGQTNNTSCFMAQTETQNRFFRWLRNIFKRR